MDDTPLLTCGHCGKPVPLDDEEILGEVAFHRSKNCVEHWLAKRPHASRWFGKSYKHARPSALHHSLDSIGGAVDAATKVWDAARMLERAGLEGEARELRDIALRLDHYANN